MHENGKGFTGLDPLSSIGVAAPCGRRWGKEQSHLGNRIAWQFTGAWITDHFTLSNTFSVTAAQSCQQHRYFQSTPCFLFILFLTLYLYTLYTHTEGPFLLPSLILTTQPDTDGCSSHTVSRRRLCLTLCRLVPLLMSLRIRMAPAALCVLDTENHSALTLQSCLSAPIKVLSLTMEAI